MGTAVKYKVDMDIDIGNGNLVFVYGTLKEGHGNHKHFLSNSLYHGPHKTGAQHQMLDLGSFPGVIYGGGVTPISGEVYEVSDKTLGRLDGLEGYPDFYNRTRIVTPYGLALMYILSSNFLNNTPIETRNDAVIESGVWSP